MPPTNPPPASDATPTDGEDHLQLWDVVTVNPELASDKSHWGPLCRVRGVVVEIVAGVAKVIWCDETGLSLHWGVDKLVTVKSCCVALGQYCETPTPGAGGAGNVGEMEKLARLATPGPWNVVYDTNVKGTRRDVGYETVIANTGTFSSNACDVTPENQANAAFIAAANPAAVLALIAERDALRAAVEKLPKTADGAPIVLGGAVFYDNRDRELRQPFTDKDFPKVRVVGLFLLGNAHSGPQDMRKVELLAGGSSGSEMGQRCRCYSTLEAALARGPAAGETTDGGGED
jgi:hypothetical protein